GLMRWKLASSLVDGARSPSAREPSRTEASICTAICTKSGLPSSTGATAFGWSVSYSSSEPFDRWGRQRLSRVSVSAGAASALEWHPPGRAAGLYADPRGALADWTNPAAHREGRGWRGR